MSGMKERYYTKCRGCGRTITFVTTAAGERMPCNPLPQDFVEDPTGEDRAYYGSGKAVRGCFVTGPCEGSVKAWRPHWGSCGYPRRAAPVRKAARGAAVRCGTGWVPGKPAAPPEGRRGGAEPPGAGRTGGQRMYEQMTIPMPAERVRLKEVGI